MIYCGGTPQRYPDVGRTGRNYHCSESLATIINWPVYAFSAGKDTNTLTILECVVLRYPA
jgi:hypothetical protein